MRVRCFSTSTKINSSNSLSLFLKMYLTVFSYVMSTFIAINSTDTNTLLANFYSKYTDVCKSSFTSLILIKGLKLKLPCFRTTWWKTLFFFLKFSIKLVVLYGSWDNHASTIFETDHLCENTNLYKVFVKHLLKASKQFSFASESTGSSLIKDQRNLQA